LCEHALVIKYTTVKNILLTKRLIFIGVATLYLYARAEMGKLKENGGLKYRTGKNGSIIMSSYSPQKINTLKQELLELKKIIERERWFPSS
jgi:hypothetical protein